MISICSTVNKELQATHTGDFHPLSSKTGLNIGWIRDLYMAVTCHREEDGVVD